MSDENRIIRIEEKIDDIKDHLGKIDVTLAAQHEVLKEHIRRTDLVEAIVKPMQKERNMVHGVIKAIGFMAVVSGIVEAGLLFIEFIRKLH